MIGVNHQHDLICRVYPVDDPVCTHPRRVEAGQSAKEAADHDYPERPQLNRHPPGFN